MPSHSSCDRSTLLRGTARAFEVEKRPWSHSRCPELRREPAVLQALLAASPVDASRACRCTCRALHSLACRLCVVRSLHGLACRLCVVRSLQMLHLRNELVVSQGPPPLVWRSRGGCRACQPRLESKPQSCNRVRIRTAM